jgi:hypothetical protein
LCSPLKVMVMVDTFLFAFLQPTHKKQGGDQGHIKGGIIVMVNIVQ